VVKPLSGVSVVEGQGPVPAFLGRMLADLGARVVKLHERRFEPAGACSAGSATAMYARVFGVGKETVDEASLAELLPAADVVICAHADEVFGPCGLRKWQASHPRQIIVTLTPFGASGPYAERPSSDLVNSAMSGYLYLTGAPDGPPLKPSVPYLSFRHACSHALAGVLLALRRRRQTGNGAHVDVSIRDAGMWMLAQALPYWDLAGINLRRIGNAHMVGDVSRTLPLLFDCADGRVVWIPLAGRQARGTARLVRRMAEEGAAPAWLQEIDWTTFELFTAEAIERFLAPFVAYFRTKTRAELLRAALEDGTILAPVQPVEALLDDPQLAARGVWTPFLDGEATVCLPRAPVQISGVDWSPATDERPSA
jgi:benzylsuccinate CoA-transferase BbsE subunit